MIRSYKYDDCTQISEHFNANEFACECHNIHDNLISDEIVEKLEEIFKAIGASKGWNCQEMCSQETHKNMNRQVSGSVMRELL